MPRESFSEHEASLLHHELVMIPSVNDNEIGNPPETVWRDSTFFSELTSITIPESESERSIVLTFLANMIGSIPIQIFFAAMFFFHIGLTMYEFFTTSGDLVFVNFTICIVFLSERVLLIVNHRGNYCKTSSWNHAVLHDGCVFMACVLELIVLTMWEAAGIMFVLLLGMVSALLVLLPRCREFALSLRRRVSADRRRYQQNGYDLDIVFIHPTIMAMSWPAENVECLLRNPASEVEHLLDTEFGPQSYCVYNLCSERHYSNTLFHGRAVRYLMDDHNPGELEMILAFARDSGDFIRHDMHQRTVVVHCKGGKGRTGTMICAYLLYSGIQRTADKALEHFGMMRTAVGAKFQGVQTPSQDRYVHYFERLLSTAKPPMPITVHAPRRVITQITLNNIPSRWIVGGIAKLWFVVILKPSSERRVIFSSNKAVIFNPFPPESSTPIRSQLRDIFVPAEETLYNDAQRMNVKDIIPPCYDAFSVHVNDKSLDTATFDNQYGGNKSATLPSDKTDGQFHLQESLSSQMQVSLEVSQVQDIPPLEGDVVIKFFYAKNNPNALKPPVQLWFHTSMEGEYLRLGKMELDGPHKDDRCKVYSDDFSITIGMKGQE